VCRLALFRQLSDFTRSGAGARTTLRCDASNAGRKVSSFKQALHRGSGCARELDPTAGLERWSQKLPALLWRSRCSRHAAAAETSTARRRHHAQQANGPRRLCLCRAQRGRLSARRFPPRRRRNRVRHSHRAGQRRSRQALKSRHRRHLRRRIPRGRRSAWRPPRPRQSLPRRVRRLSPGR
jgi:hypothetical protein